MSRESLSIPATVFEAAEHLSADDPSIRVVGSVARAALMGADLSDIKSNGVRRDIDIFHFKPIESSGSQIIDEYDIDDVYDHWIKTQPDGRSFLTFPPDINTYVEVREPEEVFAPKVVESTNGLSVKTVKPEVLKEIMHMMVIERPKDKVPFNVFDDYVTHLDGHTIHPELLASFEEFKRAIRRKKPYLAQAWFRNNIYFPLVPEKTRKKLALGKKINWLGTNQKT